jgi:hypothetical protein
MRYNKLYTLLIILFTLLITACTYYIFYTTAIPIYTFIHPTKTGGTACETFFHEHYSEFIKGEGHDNKCTNDNNPIIIIRDPADRFISMYKYWKNGSEKYKRNDEFKNNYKKYTIKDFINLIKNGEKNELCKDFTWVQHFHPIVKWIDKTDYKKIIVIQYDNNLNEKINKLLDVLKIKNKNIELPMINVSENKENIQLDNDDIIFIKSYFVDDLKLYHYVSKRPELFKHVI